MNKLGGFGQPSKHEVWDNEVRDCRGNPIEQSHRGIKQRYYPTLGFGAFESAQRFYQAYDEVQNFIRL